MAKLKALEHIGKLKDDREKRAISKRLASEKVRKSSARKRKVLDEEINRRKIELGVGNKITYTGKPSLGKGNTLALVYDGGANDPSAHGTNDKGFNPHSKRSNYHAPQTPKNRQPLTIVDLEDEEDRDKEGITEFMKRYSKLWRNIFAKY